MGFSKLSIVSVILAFAAALWGSGLAEQSVYTARASGHRFDGIHADGWVEKDARIMFPGLANWGNQLTFYFDAWRPEGFAHLKLSVCGEQRAEVAIERSDQPITISLNGTCSPREISIHGVNPFLPPGETDSRELSVKLVRAELGSLLGVPIRSYDFIAQAAVLIAILTLLVAVLLRPFGRIAWTSLLVPICSAAVLSQCTPFTIANSFYLWTCLATILLGVALGREKTLFAEATSGRSGIAVLLLVIMLGGGLRFYGLDFGLPSNFHPDEVPKVNAIMRMVDAGNLNPQYFLHPTLLLYCTYAMNLLFHNFLGFEGPFRDSAFLAGRTVSAIAGTLSIPLLFVIGKRLYGTVPGLLAALCLALFPLHVTCSRYLKEDSLLLFNVLLTTVIMIEAVYRRKPALLLAAGFWAGVAASSKYSGMLCAVIVFSGPWLASGKWMPDWRFLGWAVGGLLLMPLGFVTCTPYSVLTPEVFLRDFRSEQNHMAKGHTVAVDAWSQLWMFHYGKSMIPGMTWVPAILGGIGAGYLLAKGRIKDLFIVGLILLFYLPAEWVKAKPAPQPERYILPCLPFMALAFSVMLSSLRWRSVALALGVAAIVFPALRSIELSAEVPNDTRDRMAAWVRENVPTGAKLLIDYKRYSPEFRPEEYEVEYMLQARIIPRLDIRALKESGKDYLILSSLFYERYFSQPGESAAVRQRIRDVFARVPIAKQFRPTYGTYGFHNPTVTIFSLKAADFQRLEEELRLKEEGKLAMTFNEKSGSLGVVR